MVKINENKKRTISIRTNHTGTQSLVVRQKKKKPQTFDEAFAERDRKDKRKANKVFKNFP